MKDWMNKGYNNKNNCYKLILTIRNMDQFKSAEGSCDTDCNGTKNYFIHILKLENSHFKLK